MKTIKELEDLDRKIMEADYFASYRQPTLSIKIFLVLFAIVLALGLTVSLYAIIRLILTIISQ